MNNPDLNEKPAACPPLADTPGSDYINWACPACCWFRRQLTIREAYSIHALEAPWCSAVPDPHYPNEKAHL